MVADSFVEGDALELDRYMISREQSNTDCIHNA